MQEALTNCPAQRDKLRHGKVSEEGHLPPFEHIRRDKSEY